MLISDRMAAAINTQIGNEFGASLQYVAIGAHFGAENLPGLSAHFHKQGMEERGHAMRFVNYLVDVGARVRVPAIPAPQAEFKSAEDAVKLSLEWELTVTRQINDLVDLAISDKDHLTRNFLQWFVNEQLEEVASMETLLSTVRRAGEGGLLFVEDFLARRGGVTLPSGAPAGDAG